MKTAKLLAVAMVTLASLPLMAQQVNATAQQNASGSAAGVNANESTYSGANANVNRGNAHAGRAMAGSTAVQNHHGSANANSNAYGSAAGYTAMRPVRGELMGKLDSKSARVGEPVMLKTTQKTKTAEGMVIPKGSRLLGHVTEVQAHARGHEQSSLGIVFDRVEMKHGQSYPIHSMIEQVQPSAAALEARAMENQDAFAGPSGGPVGGGMAGGGLLGGGAGVVGGATSAIGGGVGSVDSGMNSAASGALNAGGNAVNAAGNVAGNATAGVSHGVYGSAGALGSLGTHATAIPGVMLDSNAATGASGMFTAARKNIHFDSGTQMLVGVAAAR